MARNLCTNCKRPNKACICKFVIETKNKIPVLILQHPTEVKQSKGTVALLQRSLINCQVLIGEDFSNNETLNNIIAKHQALLLYPSEKSQPLALNNSAINISITSEDKAKPPLLIILDGTWKKSYRMFMLSKNLHSLLHVCLPEVLANNGQYLIRKVAKKNALSSLEATCFALALLEGELSVNLPEQVNNENEFNNMLNKIDCGRYQYILNMFSQFNQFQLSFVK